MSNPYSLGVGVFVRNTANNKILVGMRGKACKRGSGCLALPGGHVDPGETVAQAVLREVREEADLTVELSGGYVDVPFAVPGLLAVTDHLDPNQQSSCPDGLIAHLSLWVMTYYRDAGEPVRTEPEKCEWWHWMHPREVLTWKGCFDVTHPQYYWTPGPLWRKILRPWYGEL